MPKMLLAKFNDPCVPGGKIGHVVTPGSKTATCAGSGVELTYEPDRLYEVIGVVKDFEAAVEAGWFRPTTKKDNPTVAMDHDQEDDTADLTSEPENDVFDAVDESNESEDGEKEEGKLQWGHDPEVIPEVGVETGTPNSGHRPAGKTIAPAGKTIAVCPECSGTRLGRGFRHAAGCSQDSRANRPQPSTERCPGCGGSKRGRGFSHKPGCTR